MEICYQCNSGDIVKKGKSAKGKQKYKCKNCLSILTDDREKERLTKEEKLMIDKIFKEGNSLRSIGRIIDRPFETVRNYVKKNLIISKENTMSM